MAEAAAAPMDDRTELRGAAAAFAERAERALADGDLARIPGDELERVLTAAVKLYAARAEGETVPLPPISAGKVTPTEVVTVVSEMLRAADLNLFDLAMWYRRPR